MALNPAQTTVVMTSLAGVGGTILGWTIGSKIPPEQRVSLTKIAIAGGVLFFGAALAGAILIKE